MSSPPHKALSFPLSHGPILFGIPDPQCPKLCALDLAMGRILWATRAAKIIDRIQREEEELEEFGAYLDGSEATLWWPDRKLWRIQMELRG